MTEAANDSSRVAGKIVKKKLPALGTNQIARFGGFHPLATLEKKNKEIYCKYIPDIPHSGTDVAAFIEKYFLKL